MQNCFQFQKFKEYLIPPYYSNSISAQLNPTIRVARGTVTLIAP